MLIKNANKIVLKLGSATVINGKGIFKKKWVTSLIKDIKKYGKGKNFVIVSSGAIALGQKYLKIKKGKKEQYLKDAGALEKFLLNQATNSIVIEDKNSPISQAYFDIARSITAKISNLNKDFSRKFPNIVVEDS